MQSKQHVGQTSAHEPHPSGGPGEGSFPEPATPVGPATGDGPFPDPEAEDLVGPDDEEIARGGDVDLYNVVNADTTMRENAEDLLGTSDHEMVAMMDVLQLMGVDPLAACNFTSSVARDGTRCEKLFQ